MMPLPLSSYKRCKVLEKMDLEEPRIPPPQKTKDMRLISVDEKIQFAEEELRKLRSEHNLLIPFARLPSEIMSIIFKHCVNHRPTWQPQSRMAWLNVTQVCRQWRTIALNSASIWSLIDFTNPSFTHEMILRSKAAPLDIEVTEHFLNPRAFVGMKEAFSHIDRIRRLVFYAAPSPYESQTLFANMTQPAPLLQTLEVRGIGPCTFPENFLGGEASHLREIKISGCHFPWSASLLKNLTTLSLGEPHDEPRFISSCPRCPSLKQLVEALQQMPGLENLELMHSLPLHTSEKMVPSCVVDLPRLRVLRFSGPLLSCTEVLKSVTFPSSAEVCIASKTFAPTLESRNTVPFLNRISEIYSTSTVPGNSFKCLSLDAIAPPFTISAHAHRRRDGEMFLQTGLHLDLYEIIHPTNELFRAAARVLPLAHLEELSLVLSEGGAGICDATDFVELFGSLESLKHITLEQRDVAGFLKEIRNCGCGAQEKNSSEPQSESEPTSRPCRMAFPALATMKLVGTDFGEGCAVMDDLTKFLAFRNGHAKPIEQLVLRSCSRLYYDDVEKLIGAVADVDWDGCEESEFEEDEEESDYDYPEYEPDYYMYEDDFDDDLDDPLGLPW